MYKIAVMGDYDSIYGFAALGLETLPVTTEVQAREVLKRVVQESYGIVYITEDWAERLKRELAVYEEQEKPAIIQIPGVSGNTGAGVAGVKKMVEQAVGSDILFGDQ